MKRAFILALAATTSLVPVAAHAQALPQGGSVAQGQVRIDAAGANALTITQSSDRAIVNWQGFSIGEGNRVDIVQPDARAALLNRVTGDATSRIAGNLTANGQVYLVNPNGIFIASTGTVDAGGFVASTLDIADRDFMAGEIVVTGRGGTIANAGTISIARGGYAALLGGAVSNSGLILAPLGKVALGAGTRATLDFTGDGFLQVAMSEYDSARIALSGRVAADNGSVVITAAAARDAARSVVNLSGTVAATGVEQSGGVVRLTGGGVTLAGATVDVSGDTGGGTALIGGEWQGGGSMARAQTLDVDAASTIRADARATGDGGTLVLWSDRKTSFSGAISARGGAGGGDGGRAEVSGKALLDYRGTVDLSAPAGKFGDLLLDPYNVTISAGADSTSSGFTASGDDSVINVTTLENALAGANVTVSTGTGGAQDGDITVAAPFGWTSGTTLTLEAARDIAIDANVTVGDAGKVVLTTGTGRDYRFGKGASLTFTGDADSGAGLTINDNAYTLIHSMAELADIDTAGLTGRYALATDLDAAGTTYTDALVAPGEATPFTGAFAGLGHKISNLTITAGSGNDYVGLFGSASGSLIRDIRIVGGMVSGGSYVGGLVGANTSGGTISNVWTTGAVAGAARVGGLVGSNEGAISNAYATGAVSGTNAVGGLVGGNGENDDGTISNAYATGAVSGEAGVGGLVGSNRGTISNVYATGAVSSTNSLAGGLAGFSPGTINNGWFDADTSGLANGVNGGSSIVTGRTTAQLQTVGAATDLGAAFAGGDGLYPYLASFYPDGVEAISGKAYAANGTPAVAGTVRTYVNGAQVGWNASTGANGYYYTLVAPGTLSAADPAVGATLTANGDTDVSGVRFSDMIAAGTTHLTGFDIRQGGWGITTDATTSGTLVARPDNAAQAFGAETSAMLAGNPALAGTFVTATGGFTIDNELPSGIRAIVAQAGNLTLAAGGSIDMALAAGAVDLKTGDAQGDIIIDAPIDWTSGTALTLAAGRDIAINADVTVGGAGSVDLTTGTDRDYRLGQGASLSFTGGADSGAGLTINGTPYTLIYTMEQLDAIDGLNAAGGADPGGGNVATGRYALAVDLDAAGTTYTDALVAPATTTVFESFRGTFAGLGHKISNLTIAADSSNDDVGLFGRTGAGSTIRDIGIFGGTISGGDDVGALVGYNPDGTISNAWATATVSGEGSVGGLVGYNDGGTISDVYATGAVWGTTRVGGLVGYNRFGGTINNAYATGTVTGIGTLGGFGGLVGTNTNSAVISNAYATGTVTGALVVGGLVGLNGNSSDGGIISNAYATGLVSGGGAVGGLVGRRSGGTISNAYFDTDTSGRTNGLGSNGSGSGSVSITGLTTAQLQAAAAAMALGDAFAGGEGLYPYIASLHPDGVEAISGTVYAGDGTNPAFVGTVRAYGNGAQVGWTASTGANGYYYTLVAPGTLSAADAAIGATFTAIDAAGPGAASYTDAFASGTTRLEGFDLQLGDWRVRTDAATFGTTSQRKDAAFGTTLFNGLNSTLADLYLTATGAYTIDGALTEAKDIVVDVESGSLTIAPCASVTATNGDISLATRGAFINNAGSGALSAANGRWLVYSAAPTGNTFSGLDSGNTAIWNSAAGAPVSATGNRYVFAARPTLTFAAATGSKVYGDELTGASPGLYTVSGYQAGVTGAFLGDSAATAYSGAPTLASEGFAGTASVAGGPYALTLAQGTLAGLNGYAIAVNPTNGTLSVTKRPITITATDLSRVYGEANPTLTWTIGGSGLAHDDSLTGVLATTATQASNVGDYAITQGSLAASSNYSVTSFTAGTLSVTARPISITATDLSRVYGEINPTLTWTVGGSGLANGDSLTGALATTATQASNVGDYAVTQGTLAAPSNYSVTSFTGGALAVTARPISIAANDLSRIYGEGNPALTWTVGGSGLANGDSLTGVLTTTATLASNVGDYAVTQGTLAASSNYSVTGFTDGTLAVTARPISIAANDLSRIYGEGNPALSWTVGGSGLVNGDSLTGALATTATQASNVGDYAVTQGTLAASSNYSVTGFTDGTLAVTARPISITATDLSRLYGDTNPALTWTIGGSGLVNGDNLSGALTTTATQASNVGGYGITQGSLAASSNYSVTSFTDGTLAVTARPISIAANDLSRIYGEGNPALTWTVGGSGLANGDSLTGVLTTTATLASNVGDYAVTQGTLAASSNYSVTSFTSGTLSVTARPISVTANDLSRDFGEANPVLTYTVGGMGLVNGDSLTGALTTDANEISDVGDYSIDQGTLAASGNYLLTGFTGGTLTITEAAVPPTRPNEELPETMEPATPEPVEPNEGRPPEPVEPVTPPPANPAAPSSTAGQLPVARRIVLPDAEPVGERTIIESDGASSREVPAGVCADTDICLPAPPAAR